MYYRGSDHLALNSSLSLPRKHEFPKQLKHVYSILSKLDFIIWLKVSVHPSGDNFNETPAQKTFASNRHRRIQWKIIFTINVREIRALKVSGFRESSVTFPTGIPPTLTSLPVFMEPT